VNTVTGSQHDRRNAATTLACLVMLTSFATSLSCRRGSPPPAATDGAGARRIVSLAPSVTQMLLDLGLEREIVGAGAHDPVAPRGVRAVGDLFQIDFEALDALAPTHVFLQPGRSGVPPRLEALAVERGFVVAGYDIETVDDALDALAGAEVATGSATPGVGATLGLDDAARRLATATRGALERLRTLGDGNPVDRVLVLVGIQPITAVGPGTFLDEIVTIAGGRNVLPRGATRYPVLDLERVVTLAPRVILIVHSTTGQMLDASTPPARIFAGLGIPAVESGRVHAVFDEVALLPSTSMPRVAGAIARALHPERAAAVDAALAPRAEPDGSGGR